MQPAGRSVIAVWQHSTVGAGYSPEGGVMIRNATYRLAAGIPDDSGPGVL
jgi:hypothetical protein